MRENRFDTLAEEISTLRSCCAGKTLKVILETGELQSPASVYEASWISLEAGADFIKTSTGKASPAATPQAVLVMLDALKDFNSATQQKRGIKPAGGIRTANDAIQYLRLVDGVMGQDWLTPDLIRIGASSLLNDLIETITNLSTSGGR